MDTSPYPPQLPGEVFVVEDDAAIAELLVEVLGDEGYHVQIASDAMHAVALFETACPALLLLDMHVPGARWDELVTHFDEAGCITVPIVLMTGATSYLDVAASLRITEVLSKPFDLDRLIDCVARYVRRN